MGATCHFTGKRTTFGKIRRWRGQAISKGGFGLKPTGITRRTFKPNLQTVNAILEDGGVKRVEKITVSARAIRQGLVIKPLKRKYGYTRQQKAAAAAAV
jgi:large subunit ribosomal protein L28